jgi:hypothetical protein
MATLALVQRNACAQTPPATYLLQAKKGVRMADNLILLNPAQSALLLMDYQRAALHGISEVDALIARTTAAIDAVRRHGAHVGFVCLGTKRYGLPRRSGDQQGIFSGGAGKSSDRRHLRPRYTPRSSLNPTT